MELVTDTFGRRLTEHICHAKHSITLSFFTAVPPKQRHSRAFKEIWALLSTAAMSGVKVKLLYNNPSSTTRFDNFIREQIKTLRTLPFPTRFFSSPRTLHAKFAVFDLEFCYVGSHNLTAYALHKNIEVGLFFRDPRTALKLTTLFNQLWEESHAGL